MKVRTHHRRAAARLRLSRASACAAIGAVIAAAGAARAHTDALLQSTVRVAVRVTAADGRAYRGRIPVLIVHERRAPGSRPQPFLLLEHGRATDARARADFGLAQYPANARYFAELGFVVLIPTRLGYGLAGGPDVENTGSCAHKRFAPGVAAAVAETAEVLAFARRLPGVDPARGLVVGESFGGVVAIAAVAAGLPGLVGAVNVAGGDGGDSLHRPDQPCGPDALAALFAELGRGDRAPTLWMYSANDRFWGPRYPHRWFEAFVRGGGRGRFVGLPADKNNGHFIFNRNAAAWHGPFERFAAALGLRPVDGARPR
ncbi:MAG: dienelactone hydrolase [Gammaproteobacteria bacterium]|nr:dienelactone hydrolase [Gammaproteobacteria bacterium]